MNCPVLRFECPENPDKYTRTDTRARKGNPDIVRVRFPSGFALSVSGFGLLGDAEILSSTHSAPSRNQTLAEGQ